MYLKFYGLKEKPFNLTPDSGFMFFSEKHKEAAARLKYGIESKMGFVLLTGEIGAGKTTLCRYIVNELNRRFRTALILNSMCSPTGILKAMIKDLGIDTRARTRQDMMDALYGFLLSERDTALIIDEAQNLSPSALEQIRLLGNLETEKEKLIQIILVGQPELKDRINNPKLIQLNQRIAVRWHLDTLSREETGAYIYHRLKIAGDATGSIVFEDDALGFVYNYSGGVPRKINIICDYALMAGFVKDTKAIDMDMVVKAARETGENVFSSEAVFTHEHSFRSA